MGLNRIQAKQHVAHGGLRSWQQRLKLLGYKFLSSVWYKQPTGGETGETEPPNEWNYSPPESIAEIMLLVVGNRKMYNVAEHS